MQPFYARMDANNHVINSFLGHISYLTFGKSLLVLRLPNVLSLGLFLTYLIKFKRIYKTSTAWFLFFLTLVSCHFLIDFFNLCRGYGLSMAFMTGTIYHTIRYTQKLSIKHLIAACIFLSASIWSNLSLLVFSGAVLAILLLNILYSVILDYSVSRILSIVVSLTIFLLLPLGYAIHYSLALQSFGALYFGGAEGFWATTVADLSYQISTGQTWGWPFFHIAFSIYGLAGILSLQRKQRNFNALLSHSLLCLTVSGTVLLHILMDVKYPLDRAALHFFILFVLSLFQSIDQTPRLLHQIAAILPTILMIHFASMFGFSYSTRWKTEAVPAAFYQALVAWQEVHDRPPTVSASIFQTTNLCFQDALKESVLLPNLVPEANSKYSDFIVYTNRLSKLDSIDYLLANYDTFLFEPSIPTVLFKRHEATERVLIDSQPIESKSSTELYIDLADITLDCKTQCKAFRVDIEIEARSEYIPLKWLLTTRYDANGEILGLNYSDFQLAASNVQNSKILKVSHLIERQISVIQALKIYVHNPNKKAIEIKWGQYSVTELQ